MVLPRIPKEKDRQNFLPVLLISLFLPLGQLVL